MTDAGPDTAPSAIGCRLPWRVSMTEASALCTPGAHAGTTALCRALRAARARALPVVERALGRGEEADALEALTFLSQASLTLGNTLEPYRIVNGIVDLARRRLGDGVMLWLRQPEGNEIDLAAVDHVDPAAATYVRALVATRPALLSDDFPPGNVVREGQTSRVDDLGTVLRRAVLPDEADYVRFRRLGWGETISVPMPYGEQVVGALTVSRRVGGSRFTQVELTIAEELARRGAIALANARMFREAQDAGRALQRSLLPAHPPAVEGADIAMEYRPGTAGTDVGGDFYDVIELSGGRVGLAIGDVMGRGLRAAAVMGQLRAALRAYALEDWPPAELLARLDVMVSSLPGMAFATCLYGVYEPAVAPLPGAGSLDTVVGDSSVPAFGRPARVVLACAGHPAPLLVRPDGPPRYVELDPGLPLGVGDGAHAVETTVDLPPGTSLVCFTDGLVESRDKSLTDGLEQLRSRVGEHLERSRAAERRARLDAAKSRHPAGRSAHAGAGGTPAPSAAAGEPPLADRRSREKRPAHVGAERRPGDRRETLRERRAPGAGRPPGGLERRRGGDRRRTRGGFSVRSWSGPDTVALDDTRWLENAARAVLELSLLAADLPVDTDDDTALLVLTTQSVRPPLVELSLPPVAASARQARSAVRAAVEQRALTRADDAALLVSEVCTNAIKHARSDLTVRAWAEPNRLRISVEDHEGASLPRPGRAARGDPEAESGWGLLLVEALADAWGIQTTCDGKRVWFDLDLLRPPVDDIEHPGDLGD